MKLKKFLLYTLSIFTLLFVLLILGRDVILNYLVKTATEKVKTTYHANIIINKACFMGVKEILFKDICLTSPLGDTLFTITRIELQPAYARLLLGQISYKRLKISDMKVRILSTDSTTNYAFLSKRNKKATEIKSENSPEYGAKFNRLMNKIFNLISGETVIEQFNLGYRSRSQSRKYVIPYFASDGKNYQCRVFNLSQDDTIKWQVDGLIRKAERGVDFKMIRESPDNATMVSLTGDEKSFKWLLDTLYFEAKGISYQNKELTIELKGEFSNLQLNHWRISPEDVSIENGEMDFILHIGDNYFTADTVSNLRINRFKCNIGSGYKHDMEHTYSLRVNTGKMPSADLFESLPKGMFSTLQGIKTRGEISYSLNFELKKENPDSLIFESELKKYNFSIPRFGNEYFPKINEEFIYTAYDGERPLRNFPVGLSNPDYTPLDQVSSFLKYSVLTAEDGGFLLHGGFNEEAFRQSIATNVKQGRFARGGSTISMQLVKNVYLSRNKTVSRKLEEALIVWLIEKNRLVSEERMLEVYLNIIEWGPNVYGIGEASRFYFSKLPAQLTLAESIYLASIIPHPKFFKYSFDESGQLKPFLKGFYRLVSDRMLRKNWITPADTFQLQPNITLNGEALKYVLPLEMLPTDILPPEEIEIFN